MVDPIWVTPRGMPRSVVTIIPMKIEPLTLRTNKATVRARPNRARRTAGEFRATSAGTALELAITVPPSPS
jgi:hypothetical protein